MPDRDSYAIVLESNGCLHKVTKIVFLSDGGFAIFSPYHKAQQGYLTKMRYSGTIGSFHQSPLVGYTANDRVKISIHRDGFVQFSGAGSGRIVSGRDLVTGQPKGLGIFARPLTNPVQSGPTAALTIWGLSDFDLAGRLSSTDIVFYERDHVYRRTTARQWNGGYILEVFVFKRNEISGVLYKTRRGRLEPTYPRRMPQFEVPNRLFEWKVVPTPSRDYFLGVYVSRVRIGMEASSGFFLGGPGGETIVDANGKRLSSVGLVALYPRPDGDVAAPSLDYQPSDQRRPTAPCSPTRSRTPVAPDELAPADVSDGHLVPPAARAAMTT